ncbi:DUF58 domain-containing protein [Actinocatenispora rupis]|uniref:Lipoprotein n=1 Tax=Actinocatenispora rupis TaxID=519421 RepID=A0A8J3J758_9ACTN|nr:DUF58 domain-containing protein [Actinocatenispora rupis]GID10633.1 lipoprotein [Actinocatenispora rupis]
MLTWRPVALLAALAVTLPLWPSPLLGVLCSVAAVLALTTVDLVAAAPLSAVRLTRSGPTQLRLGESAAVHLTVANRATRPLRAEVRDAWVPSAGAVGTVRRMTVPAGGAYTMASWLTPTRRGDRPAARVTVRSYGPLRFSYRQTTARRADRITPQWTVRVLPPFRSRRYLPEKLARLRVLDGAVVVRGRGQGTEFDALREYVPGDDVRSIDWRGTARRGGVVVRTWRPERDRRVLCVLDTGRTSAARIGDEPRLDTAMDACLLLAALASRGGDRVDLLAVDTAVRAAVRGAGRAALLPRFADALAPVQPSLVETDFELVTGEILRAERKRSLVVLFTALERGALSEGLLPVLPALTARHTVVLAALHDPDVAAMAADRADPYAAAAAERTLAERGRVRDALSRNQVIVVDAPADRYPSAVADAYLELKAAGRL